MLNSKMTLIFLVSFTRNTLFEQIWSIKSELLIQTEIFYILIGLAKMPECEESISLFSFYQQLSDY